MVDWGEADAEREERRRLNRHYKQFRRDVKRQQRETAEYKAVEQARAEDAAYRDRCGHMPPPTFHALSRWSERFPPGTSFWKAYHDSEPVAWETLWEATRSSGLVLRLASDSTYRHHRDTGAVFVLGGRIPADTVVKTVVCLRLDRLAAGGAR